MSTLDFLGHLQTESAMFLDAAQAADPAARVPSCPDWDADDLLWHLGEVQWFWATIVADDLRTGQQIEDLVEPERPADRAGLLAFYREQSPRLHGVAAEADPAEPRWMWVSDEALHDVAYVRRRQAHEALVHRVDAELTAGRPISPIDVGLAADGVAGIDVCTPWYWAEAAGREMPIGPARRRYGFDPVGCRMLDAWWDAGNPETEVAQSLRCYSPADLVLLLEGTGLRLDGVEPGGRWDEATETWEPRAPLERAMTFAAVLRRA